MISLKKFFATRDNITLVDVIQAYLSMSKMNSLWTLAETSGISYNTIKRISSGKSGKANAKTVFAILKALHPNDSFEEIYDNYSLSPYFRERLGHIKENYYLFENERKTNVLLNKFLENPAYSKFLQMIYTSSGIKSLSWVRQEYGEFGKEKIEELIRLNLAVILKDGRIVGNKSNQETTAPPLETARKMDSIISNDPNCQGIGGVGRMSYLYFVESVNMKKCGQELEQAFKDYREKIVKIIQNPENQGDDHTFFKVDMGVLK